MVEFEFEVRTDIKPSQIILPLDNWRETPSIESEKLAKSIGATGLWYAPYVAMNKQKQYIAIDGNRRTYATQLLEKGFDTTYNGMEVTFKLPKNWRVNLLKKTYEELGEDGIAKIRYQTTQNTVLFGRTSLLTKLHQYIQQFAQDRGLNIHQVRGNPKLNEELMNYLSEMLAIDVFDISELLKLNDRKFYHPDVQPLLYNKTIGHGIAQDLSLGIPQEDRLKTISIILKHKNRGISEKKLGRSLSKAKIIAKKESLPISTVLDEVLNSIEKMTTITLNLETDFHMFISDECKKENKTHTDLLVPILKKYFNFSIYRQ